jgi:hypothetical protein
MKNRLLTFAGILAILAVISKFYAVPVIAQVRAAIVQDRDAQGRNFYQALNSTSGCIGTCVVSFSAVPAGKRLIVQQVSTLATFGVAGSGAPAEIELRGGSVFQFLPITTSPANFGSQTQFIAHAGVLGAYDAGETPSVDAFTPNGNSYSLLANISGYMIDIP